MDDQNEDSTQVHLFGPAGDSTRLSNFTAMNSTFLKMIGTNPEAIQESASSTIKEGQSSVKRHPEEIARQMQNKRPLLNNVGQSAIEMYKAENLKLKLMIHQLQNGIDGENLNIDDINHDLIVKLLARNDELRSKLEEYEKSDRREARTRKEIQEELELKYQDEVMRKKSLLRDKSCQTNLDSLNVDELIKASITLKRQKEQERIQEVNNHHPTPKQSLKRDQQTQHPIMSQLHYQNAFTSPPKQASTKLLAPDEKKLLEELYSVDGIMTTVLDKLKAVSDTH